MFMVENGKIRRVVEKSFGDLQIRERADLQEWIRNNPDCLCMDDEGLLIIQKEFNGFSDTRERLDLLALDEKGNLVVIENKTDDSGRDVTWQALKYTAYCSTLKHDEVINIFQDYLNKQGGDKRDANSELENFFGKYNRDYGELQLNRHQRIILVARNFRKEVTSTALWLNSKKIDIRCVEVTPYEIEGKMILDFDTIIPMKEVGDYQIRVADKETEDDAANEKKSAIENVRLKFWGKLLGEYAKKNTTHFRDVSPQVNHWLSHGSGLSGVEFQFLATNKYVSVCVYMQRSVREENKKVFDALYTLKERIEAKIGEQLNWERMDDCKASRISCKLDGVDIRNEADWDKMMTFLCEKMKAFDDAFRGEIEKIKNIVRN